jgi:glycosyltransferase involved in cell wall biosynthesis
VTAAPFFSAVITLYNKAPYIERAIRSVLAQTDRDFELLVIDDGSTDDGRARAESIRDDRVRVVVQPNAGEGAARNRGIREARAPYVCFLDGDDEWTRSFLASIRKLVEDHPSAGLLATSYEIAEDGTASLPAQIALPEGFRSGLLPNYFEACASGAPLVTSSSVCVPRRIFDSVGLFAEGVVRGCDLDFWGRVAFSYPLAFTRDVGAIYHRDAEGRACDTFRFQKPWIFFETASELLARNPGFEFRRDLEDYLAARAREDALECISLGDGRTARVILQRMTRLSDRWRRLALELLSLAPPQVLGALRATRRAVARDSLRR